jgi:uncharacterized Zn finger protein (UPF0148 family)
LLLGGAVVVAANPIPHARASCLHCELPLAGARGDFCCPGCEAVHALLRTEDLERYYALGGDSRRHAPADARESARHEMDRASGTTIFAAVVPRSRSISAISVRTDDDEVGRKAPGGRADSVRRSADDHFDPAGGEQVSGYGRRAAFKIQTGPRGTNYRAAFGRWT